MNFIYLGKREVRKVKNNSGTGFRRLKSQALSVAVTVILVVGASLAASVAFAEEQKGAAVTVAASEESVSAGTTSGAAPEKAQQGAPPAAAGQLAPANAAAKAGKEATDKKSADALEGTIESFEFKDTDVKTVLASIAQISGLDVVIDPKVSGAVTIKLRNKSWKVILDTIAKNYGLNWDVSNGIIRIVYASQMKPQDLGMRTFVLNYAKAREVAGQIGSLLKDTSDETKWISYETGDTRITGKGDVKKSVASGAAEMQAQRSMATSAAAFINTNLKISYDARTNSISVVGDTQYIEKVAELVKLLDTETPQVMIEARIIETVLGDDERLGIDWNVKISATGAKRPTTVPFNFLGKSLPGLDQFLPLSQVSAGTATDAGAGGGAGAVVQPVLIPPTPFPLNSVGERSFPFALADDFTYGTLDFTEFKAVLEMLKQRSDTDTVSNPRIATLNNVLATINVGEAVHLPTFERNSTTGKMEITGYDVTDAGIVLNVVPHVNEKNEIAMDLLPQIIDYLGMEPVAPGSDVFAPKFRVRQARTQVLIRDGQTIFIGGLINDRNLQRDNKLPFIGDMLGDVPYVGLLVSHKTIIKQRVELIFFITVRVMSLDKKLTDVPVPEKAYTPVYTDTQMGDASKSKKQLKKKWLPW